MRIGSLFSGYGGLCELAAAPYLGGRVVWHCDNDPAAAKVLQHHWPKTPNLGDIREVDWSTVEPVDVLAGGFPCQDVSAAGKRAGLRPDNRSGLWGQFAYAIAELRPSLVLIENVRGLLSAAATHSDMEPCPLCVGDGSSGPVLRALGAVLGDLANLGYDAVWRGVRASDVGAPHIRFRIFVAAYPRRVSGHAGRRPAPDDPPRWWALGEPAGRGAAPVADAARDGRHEGWPEPAGIERGPDAALGGTTAPYPHDHPHPENLGGVEEEARVWSRAAGRGGPDWNVYGPAIHRWEAILGRPAPTPVVAGQRGARVLNPEFPEWMQGLPAGHITAVPGIAKNEQLRLAGNGVCPQQASLAFSLLFPMIKEVAA